MRATIVSKQIKRTSRETQNTNRENKISSRFSWWYNLSERFSFFLVVFTLILAIATVGLWIATRDLVNDAKESSITNLRAWVGPTNASMNIKPSKSQPVEISIEYQNTGKEPAISFMHTVELSTVPSKSFFPQISDDSNDDVGKGYGWVLSCDHSKERAGPVVYPTSGTNSYKLNATLDQELIDDSVISGNKIILFQGCFAYKTTSKIHHSLFCYYYKSGVTNIASLDICPSGQVAD